MRTVSLLLLALASASAWAARTPVERDVDYGRRGIVDVETPKDWYLLPQTKILPDESFYMLYLPRSHIAFGTTRFLRIEKHRADGKLDVSYGRLGVVELGFETVNELAPQIFLARDGGLYVSSGFEIVKLSAEGVRSDAFHWSRDGRVIDLVELASGQILVANYDHDPLGEVSGFAVCLRRVGSDAADDMSFGPKNGLACVPSLKKYEELRGRKILVGPRNEIYVGAVRSENNGRGNYRYYMRVARFDARGHLERAWATSGSWEVEVTAYKTATAYYPGLQNLLLAPDGGLYIVGGDARGLNMPIGGTRTLVFKLTPQGQADARFGNIYAGLSEFRVFKGSLKEGDVESGNVAFGSFVSPRGRLVLGGWMQADGPHQGLRAMGDFRFYTTMIRVDERGQGIASSSPSPNFEGTMVDYSNIAWPDDVVFGGGDSLYVLGTFGQKGQNDSFRFGLVKYRGDR